MSTYYGQPGTIEQLPTPVAAVNIASSTNATPIVVTTSAAHFLQTGMAVVVRNHLVNTAANGLWLVVVLTSTTFRLYAIAGAASVGNGVGAGTGTVQSLAMPGITLPEDAVDDRDASSVNVPFEALADMTAWLAMRSLANPSIAAVYGPRSRVLPLQISSIAVATGDTNSGLFVIPQGAILTSLDMWISPTSHGAWPPANLSELLVYGFNVKTGASVSLTTGTDAAGSLSAGNARRAISVVPSPVITMDRTTYILGYQFTNESGANSTISTLTGLIANFTTVGIDDGY